MTKEGHSVASARSSALLRETRIRSALAGTILFGGVVAALVTPGGRNVKAVVTNPHTSSSVSAVGSTPLRRGLFFGTPYDGSYAGLDAALSQNNRSDIWSALPASAIKIKFGRFHHFGPSDDTGNSFFPWDRFMAYNNNQVASGKPSLLVTATYNHELYPVYYAGSMFLDNGNHPRTGRSSWYRAVNVRDERFIQWWLDNYVQPILMKDGYPNEWVGLDNCDFKYNSYGIIDAANTFHRGVTWDQGFAQSDDDFTASIEYFLHRVKQLSPHLHLICNQGTMDNYGKFQPIYSYMDGMAEEEMDYSYANGSAYLRDLLYQKFINETWIASQGKLGLFKWNHLTDDASLPDQLRRAYMNYLLVAGSNTFFDPQFNVPEVDPRYYEPMANSLGQPVSPATSAQVSGRDVGYRTYSRMMERGIVYLNWTGSTQSIQLPDNHTYHNRDGKVVTSLTIPDMAGDYAVVAPQELQVPPFRSWSIQHSSAANIMHTLTNAPSSTESAT